MHLVHIFWKAIKSFIRLKQYKSKINKQCQLFIHIFE